MLTRYELAPARPPCTEWDGERCTLNLYGGRPGPSECMACDQYDGPSRGLGDQIERALKATGVHQIVKAIEKKTGKDCGCSERRTELNSRK
jgi:hypothetical protein